MDFVMEPARSKRKLVEGISQEEEKTYYVLEDGKFVAVNKGQDSYSLPSPPWASDDEDDDPVLEAEYYRQLRESDGFDCDIDYPNGRVILHNRVRDIEDDDIAIFAKVGLHWYNFHKGSNFQFLRVDKYNTMLTNICTYSITADAMDPDTNSRFVFQTRVMRCFCYNNEDFRIQTEICRIKPQTPGSEDSLEKVEWEFKPVDDGIDEFYKGDLKWLPDDALVESSDNRHQYYEVQDSDIRENDWLNLYAKYAFYSLLEKGLTKLKLGAPLEIVKVVVQTCEAMEPKEKLKARNAIFYIIFRGCGLTEEHRAVVRRTTDGNPQQVRLEAFVRLEAKNET